MRRKQRLLIVASMAFVSLTLSCNAFSIQTASRSCSQLFAARDPSLEHCTIASSIRSCQSTEELQQALSTAPLDQPPIAAAALRQAARLQDSASTAKIVGSLSLAQSSDWTAHAASDALIGLGYGALSPSIDVSTFGKAAWEHLQKTNWDSLGGIRLLDCILAVNKLQLDQDECYQIICRRVCKGDALARLAPAQMCLAIGAFSRQRLTEIDKTLMMPLLRRLRKQSVRSKMSTKCMSKVLTTLRRVLRYGLWSEDAINSVRVMAYTTANDYIGRLESDTGLSSRQVTNIFQTIELLDLTLDDRLVERALQLSSDKSLWTIDASWRELVLFLTALASWRCPNSHNMVRRIGERFVELVQDDGAGAIFKAPKELTLVLWQAALLHGNDTATMTPFFELFAVCFDDPGFQRRCDAGDLANVLWFLYKVRKVDSSVLTKIASLLLSGDTTAMSASVAIRILSTFTQSMGLLDNDIDVKLKVQLTALFETLGEHLLSRDLSPKDVSSAIYTYAKASYVNDMGIFDHMVELAATNVERYSCRQLAQILWSCGKMVTWEDNIEDSDQALPPYVPHALQLVERLAKEPGALAGKDVTQVILACGRLNVRDLKIIRPLTERVKALSKSLNGQEVTNIMWALAKIDAKEFDVVYALTRRFRSEEVIHPSAQECATIMYAMAKLDIRDEEIFRRLSGVMLERIGDTTAQAMANSLWAHRTVHIAPPQQLLDSWASKKLGLVAVRPRVDD